MTNARAADGAPNYLLYWIGGLLGIVVCLIGVGTVVFWAGAAYQDAATTKAGSVDLRAEMRIGFKDLNSRIDRWPLDSQKLADLAEDLKQAKATGQRRNDEQDGKIRDLQEWTKADRSWLERLDKVVQDLDRQNNRRLPQGRAQ